MLLNTDWHSGCLTSDDSSVFSMNAECQDHSDNWRVQKKINTVLPDFYVCDIR